MGCALYEHVFAICDETLTTYIADSFLELQTALR